VRKEIEKLLYELNVPRETFFKLEEYVSLLVKWNKTINLISKNDIQDIWTKHIMICAEIIRYIKDKNITLVDLGSGSGLPGIILSILGVRKTILIESNTKKAAFLLQATRISNFSVEIINDRIQRQQIQCDIVTSRALASINTLLEYRKYVKFKKFMLLIKGLNPHLEIPTTSKFSFQVFPSKYNSSSNIVIISPSI